MEHNLLIINYTAILGSIFLGLFLMTNSELEQTIKNIFYALIGLLVVEMVAFSVELSYAKMDTFHTARIFWSAVGYSVRPMLMFLILELALRNEAGFSGYRKIFILLLILNMGISFSAFFTDISYSYTSDNVFVRGPLGFAPHTVLTIYQLFLAVFTIKNGRQRRFESVMVLTMLVLITFSIIMEGGGYAVGIGRSTIVLSIIFYYMFFQSQVYKDSMNAEYARRQNLERENRMDALTGLLNKKFFEKQSTAILRTKGSEGIIFIFLDLDHFKDVNDHFGHTFGDQVLIEVAGILRHIFRKSDLVARFGGDEFCIMVRDVPKEVAIKQLNHILSALKLQYGNEEYSVGISTSIGAIYCLSEGSSVSYGSLLQQADQALYEAKNSGRDRYVIKDYDEKQVGTDMNPYLRTER